MSGTLIGRLFIRLFRWLEKLSERWTVYAARAIAVAVLTLVGVVFEDSGVVSPDQFVLRATQAEQAEQAAQAEQSGHAEHRTLISLGLVSYTFAPQDAHEPVRLLQRVGLTMRSGDAGGRGSTNVPAGVPPAFRGVLQARHFEWRKPLSVGLFAQFRSAIPPKDLSERVTRIPHENLLVMTSRVLADRACDLCEVRVTVDADTFHTVRMVFVFRNIGTFVIEELARTVTTYIPPHRPAIAPVRLTRDELDRVELQVRLLLAQTGADLRGGIRIAQTSDTVRVQGKFIDAPSNAEVGSQLRALEHVRVEGIDTAKAKAESDSTAHARALASAARVGLQQWRERRFGDAAARASFLPNLVESLLSVQQHLAVLAELGRRYPDPRHDLSEEARATLRDIIDCHYRGLRAELNDAGRRILALSGSMPSLAKDSAHAPGDLLSHAPRALSCARALEHAVGTVMADDDLGAEAPPLLNEAFRALWQSVYGQPPARE